jgi:uncharacterized protein with PCYCGC motif
MRPSPRNALVLAALMAAALAPAADKSQSSVKKKPTPVAAQNGCKTCLERRPILDGSRFTDSTIYEPDAPAAYRVAHEIPATIDRLHCFCECAENARFHHKTLLTCFTDDHAAGCGICVKEALLASELKRKGAPDDEIASLVHGMFKTEGHPPIPPRAAH